MGWQDDPIVETPAQATTRPKWMGDPEVGAPPAPKASLMDKVVGSAAGRTVLGMASPLIGAAQAGAHVGDAINRMTGTEPVVSPWIDKQLKELEASKKRGMESYGHDKDSVDWMGMIGSFLPGAAMAKGVAKALPAATGPAGRAGVAAVQGATVGAAQPSTGEDFASEKMAQGGLGALFGGAGSLAADVVKGGAKLVGDVVRPLTEKGRAQILDKYQQSRVPEHLRPAVAKALNTGGELVPGSKPTAGELVADIDGATSLATHQAKLARMSDPVATAPRFAERFGDNEKARLSAIQSFAKTPQDLEAALANRKKVAEQLYAQAYKTPTAEALPEEMLTNPYTRAALPDAKRLAQANKLNMQGPLQRLQVRSSVDQPMEPGPVTGIRVSKTQPMEEGPVTGLRVKTVEGTPATTGMAVREIRDAEGKLIGMKVGKNSVGTEAPLEGMKAQVTSRGQDVPGQLEGMRGTVVSRGQDVPGPLQGMKVNVAETRGKDALTKENSTQFGHYLKIGLDKQLSKTGDTALHDTEKKAVAQAKKQLVDWMTKNNQPYAQAKSEFVRLSQEPNQMQVGQVLEDALRSPLGTKERGTVFANAMNNAPNTIKKATGQRVHDDLGKILTPENKQKADAVMKDLARYDQYKNLAKQSSAGVADAIPGNVEPALPNILSRPAMVANFVMKKIGEGAEEKIAKEAARRYLDDPQAIAKALLRADQPSRRQQIIDALMQQQSVVGGIAAGQAGRN